MSKLNPSAIEAARRVSPRAYLESLGHTVIGHDERGHLAVDHLLRADRKAEGHWVSCGWHSEPIGDNLSLVHHLEPGKPFSERVRSLTGLAPSAPPAPAAEPDRPRYPVMPPARPADVAQGRAYLAARGISAATIAAAEQARAVAYGPNGVFFVGRDGSGAVRAVNKRMLTPEPDPYDPTKTLTKRDLAHTDKRFPMVLPGAAHALHIVEGGMDALALHDLARARGKPVPVVIVTGGARVMRWLENSEVRAGLTAAARVVIHRERELNPLTQKETDAAHAKQAEAVRAQRPAHPPTSVTTWLPPVGKDLADYHYRLQQADPFQVAPEPSPAASANASGAVPAERIAAGGPSAPVAAVDTQTLTPPLSNPPPRKTISTVPHAAANDLAEHENVQREPQTEPNKTSAVPAHKVIAAINAGDSAAIEGMPLDHLPPATARAIAAHAARVQARPAATVDGVLEDTPAYHQAEGLVRTAEAYHACAVDQRERCERDHPLLAWWGRQGFGEAASLYQRERETHAALTQARAALETEQARHQTPAYRHQAGAQVEHEQAQRRAAAVAVSKIGPGLHRLAHQAQHVAHQVVTADLEDEAEATL